MQGVRTAVTPSEWSGRSIAAAAVDGGAARVPWSRAMPLRLVIDTNVLVAALLTPGRTPARALAAVFARGDRVLYDPRMEAEYRAVLARPKFRGIDPASADALLAALFAGAERLGAVPPWGGAMADADDRAFVEVALAGGADALVTGNARHYPTDLAFAVLSPAALLERIAGY